MGRREWLTEAGWRQAYDAGIRTVVDLRNEPEIRRRETDPPVRPAALAGFDVVLAPTEDPANTEYRQLCVPYLNHPAAYADNTRLFPNCWPASSRPWLPRGAPWSSTAPPGATRSGMIAAMVQDLAGHSDEAIVQGYQRSMRGINEHHRRAGVPHPHQALLPDDVLSPLLEERGASLLQFVRTLNTAEYLRRHGSRAGSCRRSWPRWADRVAECRLRSSADGAGRRGPRHRARRFLFRRPGAGRIRAGTPTPAGSSRSPSPPPSAPRRRPLAFALPGRFRSSPAPARNPQRRRPGRGGAAGPRHDHGGIRRRRCAGQAGCRRRSLPARASRLHGDPFGRRQDRR